MINFKYPFFFLGSFIEIKLIPQFKTIPQTFGIRKTGKKQLFALLHLLPRLYLF